uniref:SEP domain-containing protein n=1 Tax=Rhodnius prolixus TaxID=13249 RepID=T1HQF9_RHOPR
MNQDQLGQNSNSGSSAETTDDSVELRRFRRYYLESALWNLEIVSRSYRDGAGFVSGQQPASEDSDESSVEPDTSSSGGLPSLPLNRLNTNENPSSRFDFGETDKSHMGPGQIVSTTYREGAGTFRLQPPIEPPRNPSISRDFFQDSNNAREDSDESSSVEPETSSSDSAQSLPLNRLNPNVNPSSSEGEDEEVVTQEPHGHDHPPEGPYGKYYSLIQGVPVNLLSFQYFERPSLTDKSICFVSPVVDTMAAGYPPCFSEVAITMWRDGFSVDNGALRSYTELRERVQQGHVLAEIFPRTQRGAIFVSLEDHRLENYVSPTAPTDFPGTGRRLGSTESLPTEEQHYQGAGSIHPPVARTVRVDESLPTTNIQA